MDSEDDLHYSTDDDCDFYSGDMDMGMAYYSDEDDPEAEDFVDDDTDDYFESRRREVAFRIPCALVYYFWNFMWIAGKFRFFFLSGWAMIVEIRMNSNGSIWYFDDLSFRGCAACWS